MSLITNRQYILKIDGSRTDTSFKTFSGVPQGSHCGPLLYLIMTADLMESIADVDVRVLLYADDTKFYRKIESEEDIACLQLAIDRLETID